MGILETVANILATLPPDAVGEFAEMLGAIISGKPDKAERLARLTAETVAAKAAVKKRFAGK
jgi:hypothetical protein